MSYTDMLGVTVDEFPVCPACTAEGKPNCYLAAPSTWYPFEDLPVWHAVWAAFEWHDAFGVHVSAQQRENGA